MTLPLSWTPRPSLKGCSADKGTFQASGENYQKDKILEELNLISSRHMELTIGHPISKGKEFGNILFDLGGSREHHPQGSGELGKDSPQVLSKLGKQEKSREQFEIKPFSVSINDEKGPNNIASPNKSLKDEKSQRYHDDTNANKDHTSEILKEATMEVNKNHQSISGKEAEENLAERGLFEGRGAKQRRQRGKYTVRHLTKGRNEGVHRH
jgi:hypothetical protein